MLRTVPFLLTTMLCAAAWAQAAPAVSDETVQAADAEQPKSVTPVAPAPATEMPAAASGASEPMPPTLSERLALGYSRWQAGNLAGAQQAYESARELGLQELSILLYLGSVLFQQEDMDGAVQAYTAIVSLATESDAAVKGKALMGLARVAEARRDAEGAKMAWGAYRSFVAARPNIPSYADTAQGRIAAIEIKQALDAQYQVVVDRLTPKAEETPSAPKGAAADDSTPNITEIQTTP